MQSILTEFDLQLFGEGKHSRAYEKLGAHFGEKNGRAGVHLAVWAPSASAVSIVGDFNAWNRSVDPMQPSSVGVWEGFVPGVKQGARYKYHIVSAGRDYSVDKGDPYGFSFEVRPGTASRVWNIDGYSWNDASWMSSRASRNSLIAPVSIYEVHLGSWKRLAEEGNRWLTYLEIALLLPKYVKDMGFTHVEFLPVMEHPFDGSWGYETTGYFAPTSRFGTPDDFMYLIDSLHQSGIGVILDWVPGHFPKDDSGLGYFDGSHLYEHANPKQGEHSEWNTFVFNYGRKEVRNFLISNAMFWFTKYHADGLRVDAVASMLYLDYSRSEEQWVPNKFGGRENIEAIDFLRSLNEQIYSVYPDGITIAEESTAWPQVSRPTYLGGLGFGLKWNMGWMHDVLSYISQDPIFRKFHHDQITFSLIYAFTENFVLPFSHDEVVYGKGSMLHKMPGDEWQKFANLRLLYGFMFGHPGKKLMFMGDEFGQWDEWSHDGQLDWNSLGNGRHAGLKRWVRDLNALYRGEPALYQLEFSADGFEWVDCKDFSDSVISFLRRGQQPSDQLLFACNFTPVPRHNYRIGVPFAGFWKEILNGDAPIYGGSGQGNLGGLSAAPLPIHGRPFSINVTLPPLGIVVFKPESHSAS